MNTHVFILFQAFMFPTIHAIIARWATPNERSRLVGFIMSGKYINR